MELEFKRDTAFRKQFFTPESFAHPAKMDAQLLLWIVERYTKPGEVILDRMAGMGTTMLACTLGRNVVLVELEEKFCKMSQDNWEIVKTKPQLGYEIGDCQIIQGDARQLEGLLVDKCIFSPPFSEAKFDYGHGLTKELSPNLKGRKAWEQRFNGNPTNPDNIANLPYGQIDKIVTSPPYENQIHPTHEDAEKVKAIRPADYVEHSQAVAGALYKPSSDNIGNLKSDSYLEAMLQVYQQCHKVLKPQGLMILVTKNFIRNKQVVKLDEDTIKLCEQAGFSFLERHYRKLTAQSFWRIIYHQKYPGVEKIEHEDVLVFGK